MPIVIGNTRISLPQRTSYVSKDKSQVRLSAIENERYNDDISSVAEDEKGVLQQTRGPGNHTWTIRQLVDGEEHDGMQMAPWKRPFARLIGLSAMATEVLSLCCTYYQVRAVLDIMREQEAAVWRVFLAWFIISINLLQSTPNIPHVVVKLRAYWGEFRPRLRLVGTDVPNVDVVIPCCREPIDVLQDTIIAALALDYPQDRFRVIVSDDGGSTQLKSWIAKLIHYNLYYTARNEQDRTGFKAGNLNHAVRFIEYQLGGPAEFMASLDADMIPERDWLRAVTSHMVLDPELGVVCPSQSFYNFPDNDPLYQSQLSSWRCTDIIRDLAGISWNTGSGFIVRRQALMDIGGFPTHCLIEDVLSSMIMMAKGWKTGYLAESLQYGLMPDCYLAHVKQFTRWNLGGVQMAAHFKFYLSKTNTELLTVWQRLLGMTYGILNALMPFLIVIEMITMPFYLLKGIDLVYFADLQTLRFLLRIRSAAILTKLLHNAHLGLMSGFLVSIRDEAQSQYMAPCRFTSVASKQPPRQGLTDTDGLDYAIANLRSFMLPRGLGGTAPGFTPSGSIYASVHERSTAHRAPLTARLRHIFIDCGVWFHMTMSLALSCAAAYRIGSILAAHPSDLQGQRDWHGLSVALIRGVLWPYPGWFVSLLACLTPIKYALMPPDVLDREDCLGDRDEKGARYPTACAKKERFTWINIEFAQLYLLTVIPYSAFLFFASWWI